MCNLGDPRFIGEDIGDGPYLNSWEKFAGHRLVPLGLPSQATWSSGTCLG